MADLRVITWNVRSLRDDRRALVDVLRELAPDVVLLQEAPRFLDWRGRLAELARRSGLLYTSGGRDAGGPALLTALRVDVREPLVWRLPKTPGQFQRGFAGARIRVDGVPALVGSIHLGLSGRERTGHVGELLARLSAADVPVVFGGDVNETADGPAWRAVLAAGYRDAYAEAPHGRGDTFPAVAPVKRIDAVFVSAQVAVHSAGVPDVAESALRRATDHRPVLADLSL